MKIFHDPEQLTADLADASGLDRDRCLLHGLFRAPAETVRGRS
ncbi:hypothetical protein [Nonomuraea antri]|nr:hypothetical protein [Nonomuraea antri]